MNTILRLFCAVLIGTFGLNAWAGETQDKRLKVLVVTGGHGFEVEPFFKMFQENPEIEFTAARHRQDADVYERDDLFSHDVVVLYDMPKSITDVQKLRFLELFSRGIGVVVLHHALVAYQAWPEYEQIIGGRYPEPAGKGGVVTPEVGYQHDVDIPVTVVSTDHPVTKGIGDFTIHDEIYWGFRVQPDVTPLLSTTHPRSGKPLAWAKQQGESRLVYLQLGHGRTAFEHPQYRQLLNAGIRWVAENR